MMRLEKEVSVQDFRSSNDRVQMKDTVDEVLMTPMASAYSHSVSATKE